MFQDAKNALIRNQICKVFYLNTFFGKMIPLRFCQSLIKTCQKPMFPMGESMSLVLEKICEIFPGADFLQIGTPTEEHLLNRVRM